MRMAFLVLVLLVGCDKTNPKPFGSTETNNSTIKVEHLFTDEDGYTVKRFNYGQSTYVYVTPGPALVRQTYPVGKLRVHREIPTLQTTVVDENR